MESVAPGATPPKVEVKAVSEGKCIDCEVTEGLLDFGQGVILCKKCAHFVDHNCYGLPEYLFGIDSSIPARVRAKWLGNRMVINGLKVIDLFEFYAETHPEVKMSLDVSNRVDEAYPEAVR